MTFSCHRCLGLPTGLVPTDFQSSSFLVGLAWSILWICPSHLILCTLMNLTISAPSIKLSIYMLFRILHTLSILTGPNIFLNICLSKMHRLFSSSAVTVPVSDQYVTTGLIIVLYIFILVFFLRVSILLVLNWHSMLCCLLVFLQQSLRSLERRDSSVISDRVLWSDPRLWINWSPYAHHFDVRLVVWLHWF